MGEITEDDIRVGSSADIKWTRKGVEDVFPALLLKTRVQKGQLQYKVHYKNWNKRYDEWISIERVMRIYDDDGTLVKSRLTSSEGSGRSSPADSDDEKRTTRGAAKKKAARTKSVLEALESSSDEEENDEEEGEEEEEENGEGSTVSAEASSEETKRICINCDKPAQDASKYCSVDCILISTKKAKQESNNGKETPELSPPPLEKGDPDQPSEDEEEDDDDRNEDDDDDFVPPEDAKAVKTKRGRPKKTAESVKKPLKKSKSVEKEKKKPKPPPEMSDKEIEEIMEQVAPMKDTDPIIVLKYGQLLTGYNAPKKNNLREFLEKNRVGIKVVLNNKAEKQKREEENKIAKQKNLNSMQQKMKMKYEAAKNEAQKVVIKEGSNAYSAREQKVYSETEAERKARKEKRRKEKMLAMAFPEEAKKKQEKKKGQVSDDTLELMRAIKARRTERAAEEKAEKEKELKEKKKADKERRKSDGDRKRLGSSSNAPETPTKKSRRESLPATPQSVERSRNAVEDPRSTIRKKLREILNNRSSLSATNGTEKLVMNQESIAKLVAKIEKEMFKSFGEVNKDYKNKFRQIQFNLKEPKNDYFWRRVITGEISASTMHKMSSNDMATVEMLQEREKQQKEALEQVLKIEEQKQKEAARPTAKITHKGEIEIERFDDTVNRSELEITNSSLNVTADKAPSPRKAHSPEKKPESPKKKKVSAIPKISDVEMKTIEKMMKEADNGVAMDPPMEWENGNEDEELPEAKTPEYVFDPDSPDGEQQVQNQQKVENSSSINKQPETEAQMEMESEELPTPEEMSSTSRESSPGIKVKQPDPESSNVMTKVWTGRVSFPEGQKVHANGYFISGGVEKKVLKRSLAREMKVCGSIGFADIGKYLTEVREVSDPSRICVMALYGLTASEQEEYREALTSLTEKAKCGVVKLSSSNEIFKDLYIVPLKDDEELPNWLLPMNGPGLDVDHPAIFLLVMVKRNQHRSSQQRRPEREKHRSRERTSSSRSHHSDKSGDSETPPVVAPASGSEITAPSVLPISEENFENIKETLKLLNPASLQPDPPLEAPPAPPGWGNDVPPPITHPPIPPLSHNPTADPYYDHPPHQPSRDFDMRSNRPPPPSHYPHDDRGWDRRGPPPRDDYYRDDRRGYDRGPPPRGWHDGGPSRGGYRGGGRGRGRGFHHGGRRDY